MKLKTLELKGFKSFANETVLHFDHDVIGVVGPNGSGKSNIVDAIRWVLGEQKSRELRLDQMSSVIFNGTKKRKPAGLAKVSLTFDNTKNLLPTDYSTITITRMLYRSGESEYRLNNVPCRLKDITSLFLDTGVGSNSYAIIALNMVDDILADKDNARRRMFEQAAGISKYKARKRETLNKLKNTTANLDRVEDLLFEIENNLKTLEKQAKRTQRYFDLKEKYKLLSLQLAKLKSADLTERNTQLKQQLQQEENAYRQLEVEARQLEAQLEQEKKANLDKEKNLSHSQRELNELVNQLRNIESDRKIAEQRLDFIRQNAQRLQNRQKEASEKLAELQQKQATLEERIREEKAEEAQLLERLREAERKKEEIGQQHGSLKSGLDEIVQQQQALEKRIFELEKQKAIHANQIENAELEIARLGERDKARKGEVLDLQNQLKTIEEEERRKQKELQILQQAEEERKREIHRLETQIDELLKKIQKVNRSLDAKRNEYQLTKSMIDKLEGFPESIKFLNQNKEWQKKAPLLSDILYVEETYRIAIENYLEPYLNYYVVQNLDEALRAIKLLHKTQKGKANFFLLDAFKEHQPQMKMLPGMRQATDFIQTDDIYRPLVAHLLANVLITETEDPSVTVDDDITLLSKSGTFIRRTYSVSGGSVGLFEGKKIGRKKNLEILEKAIRKAEAESNSLNKHYQELKARLGVLKEGAREMQLHQLNKAINELNQQRISLQTRLDNYGEQHSEAEEKARQLRQSIAQMTAKDREIEQNLIREHQALEELKESIREADSSYRQIADELSSASAAYNESHIHYIRQQNKVQTLENELAFLHQQRQELQGRNQQDTQAIQESSEEETQLLQRIENLKEALKKAYDQKQEREAKLSDAEQNYFHARGKINEIEEALRKKSKKQQDSQILINNLKDKLNELRYQLSTISERLHIEFGMRLEDIKEVELPEGLSLEELQLKVDRLRNRLENYGEINPLAVEAYEEMKERYDNISAQRDDILQAKEDLLETIREIEETATEQFMDAFEKVRIYFQDVFRSLFTEDDTCDLVLLDPENPLESKIEIIAKPKGKRPQTISQLSGGEKTLTATALLFALYLLKPAPFCIFDEVDAPLDDANIEKFNKIIKKFSKDSQFIIVTHNKQTMAAVDTIYGVYMHEQGVSGVAPVDFRNYDHQTLLESVGG